MRLFSPDTQAPQRRAIGRCSGLRLWSMLAGVAAALAWQVLAPTAHPVAAAEPIQPAEAEASSDGAPQPGLSAEAVAEKQSPREQRIARLIEQLGAPDYFVRKRAQAELAELGFEAFDALMAAANDSDLERATRARYLLQLLGTQWIEPEDPPEVQRLLSEYQSQPNQEKLGRIRQLGALPEGKGLDALVRIVRRERSEVLSKWAAIEWMRHAHETPDLPAAIARMKQQLQRSRRVGAGWLVGWARVIEAPDVGLAEWAKRVAAEKELLSKMPKQSSPDILAALLRLEIEWCKQAGRTKQAMEAMQRLVTLDSSDPEMLVELLEWLIEQQAWDALEQVSVRSASTIKTEPRLLYLVAEAQLAAGKDEAAEQTARQAAALNPGASLDSLVAHLQVAYWLRERGLFDWAEREYRHITTTPAPNRQVTYLAWVSLGEMLHELAKDQQAAEALGQALTLQARFGEAQLGGRDAQELRSRQHYFLACHYASAGDRTRQCEELDKAIALDPPDLDALIARYQMLPATPQDRERVVELIRRTAEELESFIGDEPDNPSWYNQYAWLVGNTEGDLDKALRYSRKSLELRPDAGGYYDTLAHVYFARGEYQRAVETQQKAVELEPHSPIIRRKLEVFRAALKKHLEKKAQGEAGR